MLSRFGPGSLPQRSQFENHWHTIPAKPKQKFVKLVGAAARKHDLVTGASGAAASGIKEKGSSAGDSDPIRLSLVGLVPERSKVRTLCPYSASGVTASEYHGHLTVCHGRVTCIALSKYLSHPNVRASEKCCRNVLNLQQKPEVAWGELQRGKLLPRWDFSCSFRPRCFEVSPNSSLCYRRAFLQTNHRVFFHQNCSWSCCAGWQFLDIRLILRF